MPNALVCMVMGSASDWPIMPEATEMLTRFQVPDEVAVRSAQGALQRLATRAREAAARGVQAIIAGAGGATPWAGVIAAETALPVPGAPIDTSPLCGLDASLATAQRPRGVAAAMAAVGKAGAAPAGGFAAPMMAAGHPDVAARLKPYEADLAAKVEPAAEVLPSRLQGL